MRFLTTNLKDKTWRFLQHNQNLDGFESKEEFEEEFEGLGEVARDGSLSYVSRRSTEALFEPANLRLTNIESEFDFERISFPAISGGED